MAIKKNSVVHAGANNQFGGLKKGFTKPAYHVGMFGMVKIDPSEPKTWHTIIIPINFKIFFASIKTIMF